MKATPRPVASLSRAAHLGVEAIRLGRLLRTLMAPRRARGGRPALLALMLLHDARRDARLDEAGDPGPAFRSGPQPLESRADCRGAADGGAVARGRPGPYALQAAIAALHCQAARAEDTDWRQIVRLYELLERVQPSPIVTLNRAVAVVDGRRPAARRCASWMRIAREATLDEFHLLHATRADSALAARRGGRGRTELVARAGADGNDGERRFLERRPLERWRLGALDAPANRRRQPWRRGPINVSSAGNRRSGIPRATSSRADPRARWRAR